MPSGHGMLPQGFSVIGIHTPNLNIATQFRVKPDRFHRRKKGALSVNYDSALPGLRKCFSPEDVFPAAHNLGVARIGHDPATSVCNPWGQTHDIDNLFVSDGSLMPTVGCENPTLTIVALVLRQADYIQQQFEKGAI